jgi:hypothetical protein
MTFSAVKPETFAAMFERARWPPSFRIVTLSLLSRLPVLQSTSEAIAYDAVSRVWPMTAMFPSLVVAVILPARPRRTATRASFGGGRSGPSA